MSILGDIQRAATDPAHSTSDLLRKCQILAFRLRHEPFKQWVAHELNGYPDDAVLPSYRGPFQADLKADTHGAFGSGVRNIGVPDWSIPDDVREEVKGMAFYQGVGTLESLVADARRASETMVATEFSTDLAVLTRVVVDHQTVRMWKQLSVAVISGILDSVRSKALEFVLEIEAANPDAGATATAEPPVPLAQTDVIFNTVILGGNNAIGPGATVNVTPGDLGGLLAYLTEQGVAAEDRAELEAAVNADGGEFGPRVRAWLGSMAAKAASVGAAVAEKAAVSLVSAAVLRYFNLG